jgi:glycosyltransferase involved in cell wall biosynthesis
MLKFWPTAAAVSGGTLPVAPSIGRARFPRILYLTPYWPDRVTSASEVRAVNIARALRECGDLQVAVVGGEDAGEKWTAAADQEFKVACCVPVSTQCTGGVYQKLGSMLNPRTNYPDSYGVDRQALQQIRTIAERFDLIWFCKLRTADNFPIWAWPRSVVDVDDLPSIYERSVWRRETRLKKRLSSANRLVSKVRRERLLSERFGVLAVCSEADKRYLERLKLKAPLHVIPNGYARPSAPPIRSLVTPPRIGFIGIFDYEPNLEGIRWFVSECWPIIKREVVDARLRLAGRCSDGRLKPLGADIDGLGWVDDAAAEIATWSAMVVPIRRGAGTRGKIAHSLSLKCPIVSTVLGAYGYELTNRREAYLADSAEEFAKACIRAIRQPVEAAAMAERGWQMFLEKWTWDAIKPRIWSAVEDSLRLSNARSK